MRKLLIAGAAIGALFAAVPASAQVGVQVGPFGAGVGPGYGYGQDYGYGYDYGRGPGWREHYAYGGDCRTIRERTRTPSGRLIVRTHRVCD